MPFPNEHACRLQDPGQYESFSRTKRTAGNGKGYSIILGIKGDGKSEEQSYRYNKDVWTEDEARGHCQERKGTFEAAQKCDTCDDAIGKVKEIKYFDFELKDFDRKGRFQGMLSTNINVDPAGDRFLPGVWKRTLTMKESFPLLKNHDGDSQLGSFTGKDVEEGLFIDAGLNLQLIKDSAGKEIAAAVPKAYEQYALYTNRDAKGLSVAFRPIRDGVRFTQENDRRIRNISEAELVEGSMTPFPMNVLAQVDQIKSLNNAVLFLVNNLADKDLKYKIFSLYGYGPEDIAILESRAKALTPGPVVEPIRTNVFGEDFVKHFRKLGG